MALGLVQLHRSLSTSSNAKLQVTVTAGPPLPARDATILTLDSLLHTMHMHSYVALQYYLNPSLFWPICYCRIVSLCYLYCINYQQRQISTILTLLFPRVGSVIDLEKSNLENLLKECWTVCLTEHLQKRNEKVALDPWAKLQ